MEGVALCHVAGALEAKSQSPTSLLKATYATSSALCATRMAFSAVQTVSSCLGCEKLVEEKGEKQKKAECVFLFWFI